MIKSFADKETEKVYNQIFSRKLPQIIQRVALRKLIMIDNAGCLEDLKVPPANHLEPLHGDREGQYSIRIMISIGFAFWSKERMIFNWSKSLIIIEGTHVYHGKQRGGA